MNALRLALAICVIVSHAWPIGGFGAEPRLGRMTLGHFAVYGFFAISGWLITQSRLKTELPSYAWRRFLRIYPGFLVSLLAVAFVYAPIGAALGGGAYSVRDGFTHVAENFTLWIGNFAVGSTPSHVPDAHVWNGSLWTLIHEVACYVIVGLSLTVVGRRRFSVVLPGMWAVLTVLELLDSTGGHHIGGAPLLNFLTLAPYFFAGASLYAWRERLPLNWRAAAAAFVWCCVVVLLDWDPVLIAPALAYVLLWLGARLPLHQVGRKNDISYGMYVYAFPTQQLLVLLGVTHWGTAVYVLISIAATVPLAALSWFAIERPAQRARRLADRFPVVRSGYRITRRSEAATPVRGRSGVVGDDARASAVRQVGRDRAEQVAGHDTA